MTARKPALLVDLDGVLRGWPRGRQHEIERARGLPAGVLSSTAFEPALLRPAVRGDHDHQQWLAAVADRIAARFPGVDAQAAVMEWSAYPGVVDPQVLDFLDTQRVDHTLCILTNATTKLPSDLAALGLAGRFDHVISSADLGVAKPDEAFFQAAARIAGLAPRRCLLVDDSAANVRGAQQAGMSARVFTDIAELGRVVTGWRDELRAAEEKPGTRVVIDRHAVRVLCLDPDERVLLLRFRDPVTGEELWEPPGGSVEADELDSAAAAREFLEETGLAPAFTPGGGVVVRRDYRWCAKTYRNEERFFFARVTSVEPDRATRLTASEENMLLGSRWWSWAELAGAGEVIEPPELATLLADLAPESVWAHIPRLADTEACPAS